MGSDGASGDYHLFGRFRGSDGRHVWRNIVLPAMKKHGQGYNIKVGIVDCVEPNITA